MTSPYRHGFLAMAVLALWWVPLLCSGQLIVALTGPCTQSVMQIASSGTFLPFLNGVIRDLGNVQFCNQLSDSRFCSFAMTLVCVENDDTESVLYTTAACTGPEPVLGMCVPSAAVCPTSLLQAQVTNFSLSDQEMQSMFSPGGFCSNPAPSKCNLTKSYAYLKASCLDEEPDFRQDSGAVAVFAVIVALCSICLLRPLFRTLRYLKTVFLDMWILDREPSSTPSSSSPSPSNGKPPAAAGGDESAAAPPTPPPRRPSLLVRVLTWFDLFDNLNEFFSFRSRSTKVAAGVVDTQFFEGLRTIAMLFVLYGHSFFFPVQSGVSNSSSAIQWIRTYAAIGIFPAELAVDTFFFLSGFLTFHLLLKHTEKKHQDRIKAVEAAEAEKASGEEDANAVLLKTKKHQHSEATHETALINENRANSSSSSVRHMPLGPIDTLLLYLRRWLRMTPVVMLTLVSATWLLQYVPTNDVMRVTFENQSTFHACRVHWWRQLLYITNLDDFAGWEHCMDWFWYLACDFQMFIAAPILLLPYYAHPTKGPWIWIGFASCLILIIVICQNYYQSYLGSDGSYYDKSYLRASPYVYGGIAAVLIRQPDVRAFLSRPRARMTLYGIAILLAVSSINIMWSAMRCYQMGGPAAGQCTQQFYNFMNSWVTFAYGFALVLFSLPQCCGYKGPLGRFLSNPVFVVLSKLTFCMYMLHPIVILLAIASGRHYPFFSALLLYKEFAGVFVITAGSALALHVVAEVPFAKINDALTR